MPSATFDSFFNKPDSAFRRSSSSFRLAFSARSARASSAAALLPDFPIKRPRASRWFWLFAHRLFDRTFRERVRLLRSVVPLHSQV